MAKYRLKRFSAQNFPEQKLYMLNEYKKVDGKFVKVGAISDGSGIAGAIDASTGKITADATANATRQAQANILKKETARATERAANIANPGRIAGKQGFERGAKSVGVLGGIKNTWNKGGAGKAGLIAAGTGAALLAGKALFGGKKKDKDQK